jgi:hypothetical protein
LLDPKDCNIEEVKLSSAFSIDSGEDIGKTPVISYMNSVNLFHSVELLLFRIDKISIYRALITDSNKTGL